MTENIDCTIIMDYALGPKEVHHNGQLFYIDATREG